ncbi:zinc metalloproteinase nas-4-like [Argopecten irradians]|uniref:zinc metalloproteinase nas-4-like n=1 Tax=Argopecten irradians TaxID=31199 RepID=UPI003723235B
MNLTRWVVFLCVFTSIHCDGLDHPQVRNVINDKYKLWEHETVVYQISTLIDDSQHAVIEQAMKEIQNDVKTGEENCVCFEKKEGDFRDRSDYLFITEATDGICKTSRVGMVGGRQKLYLTDECMNKREIMSLLLVTLGLYHEHQRPDRDQYIHVHTNNIQDAARPLFNKIPTDDTDLLGLPYDFDSITHFGPYDFAKSKSQPTITAIKYNVSFGGGSVPSFYDVLKVQMLYQCHLGYTMFGGKFVNLFQQLSTDYYYPQWRVTSESLPDYMTTGCSKNDDTDMYTLTVLNGANWTSNLPLPPGNFCISVDICISSSSPDIKSYIQLTKGTDSNKLNYVNQSGCWTTLNIKHASVKEWDIELVGHILWGGDVLALDNIIIRRDIHCGA